MPFPMQPEFKAMQYHGYSRRGTMRCTFSAARILKWHIKLRGSTKGNLFAPLGASQKPSRIVFKTWLQESFRRLLIGKKSEMEALVRSITPHSFRAGMAGDLERERVPRLHIKKIGRWESDSTMEQYARDGLAQRLQALKFRSLVGQQDRIHMRAFASQPRRRAVSGEVQFEGGAEARA